jgi:hypothetical protein
MSNISSTWIIIGILVVLVVWIVMIYNGLVAMRQRVNQSFADIDVQLKQRHDLAREHLVMVGDMDSDAHFAVALGANFYSAEEFFGHNPPVRPQPKSPL